MSGPVQTQAPRSMHVSIRKKHPTIAKIDQLASQGAHRPVWKDSPRDGHRSGYFLCACGWKSSRPGEGSNPYREGLAHAEETLPAPPPSVARSADRPVDLAHAIVSLASAAERRRGARADLIEATDTVAMAIRKQLRSGDSIEVSGSDEPTADAFSFHKDKVSYRAAAIGSLGFEDPLNERRPFLGSTTDVLIRDEAILGPLPQERRDLIDEGLLAGLRQAQQRFDVARLNGDEWPEVYVDSFLLHPATADEREAFVREAPAVIEAFREMLDEEAKEFDATAKKTVKLTPR